jgi:transposase/Mn-dependent DtxR family transcriptional regulator
MPTAFNGVPSRLADPDTESTLYSGKYRSHNVRREAKPPEIKGLKLAILNALAKEDKIWTARELAQALFHSEYGTLQALRRLRRDGLVIQHSYRLTGEGKITEKGYFMPNEVGVVEALKGGGLTFTDIGRKTGEKSEVALRRALDTLIAKEMVARVNYQLSETGRETLKELGSAGEAVDDIRVKTLLLIAGGCKISGLAPLLGRTHATINALLEGMASVGHVSRGVVKNKNRDYNSWEVTEPGKQFIAQYLLQAGAVKKLAAEKAEDNKLKAHPSANSTGTGQGLNPMGEANGLPWRVKRGEVKIRLLQAIADSTGNSAGAPGKDDPRLIYAELPYKYAQIITASKEAKAQGLIGEGLVVLKDEPPKDKESRHRIVMIKDSREILQILAKKPLTEEALRKKLKIEDGDGFSERLEEMQALGAIEMRRLFLTPEGEALLASSKELVTKSMLRKERHLVRLGSLTQEEARRLEVIAKDFGKPAFDGLDRWGKINSRRAKTLLLAAEGLPTGKIAAEAGVPAVSNINYTITRFNAHRMMMFDPSFRIRKAGPRVKLRELNVGEADRIKEMSDRFDKSRRRFFPLAEYTKVKYARIIYLASQKAFAKNIAMDVDAGATTVNAIIRRFNAEGMALFDKIYSRSGIPAGKLFVKPRALTDEETREIHRIAKMFDEADRSKMGRISYARLRYAKIVELAMQDATLEEIREQAGLTKVAEVYIYIRKFNRAGMDIFKAKPPKKGVRELKQEELDAVSKLAKGFDPSLKSRIPSYDFIRRRKANIILLSSRKVLTSEIAKSVELTPSAVHTIIRSFNKDGMGILEPRHEKGVRELKPEELEAVSKLAKAFDSSRKAKLPQNDLARLRRAKIIMLSSKKVPAAEIAEAVGMAPITVHARIRSFDEMGMDFFGQKPPKSMVRELRQDELDAVTKLAKGFDVSLRKKMPYDEFVRVRKAEAVLLSSKKVPAMEIAETTGLTLSAVRHIVSSFNKNGMAYLEKRLRKSRGRAFVKGLSEEEKDKLMEISKKYGKDHQGRLTRTEMRLARTADVVLLSHSGKTPNEICVDLKASYPKVRAAIRDFNKQRMEMFERKRKESKVRVNKLNKEDRTVLEAVAGYFEPRQLARMDKSSASLVKAAKVLLLSDDGNPPSDVEEKTGIRRASIYLYVKGFNKTGVKSFENFTPTFRVNTPTGSHIGGRRSTLFVRELTSEERSKLEGILSINESAKAGLDPVAATRSERSAMRAKMILLSSQKRTLKDITGEMQSDYQSAYFTIRNFNKKGMQVVENSWNARSAVTQESIPTAPNAADGKARKPRMAGVRQHAPSGESGADRILKSVVKAFKSPASSNNIPRTLNSIGYPMEAVKEAFDGALSGGMLGKDLVQMTLQGSASFKKYPSAYDPNTSSVMKKIQDKPQAAESLAEKLGMDAKEVLNIVERLEAGGVVTTQKVFVTEKGYDFLGDAHTPNAHLLRKSAGQP